MTALVKKIATEQELRAMNAEQIKREVLSGQPRNSLQQQREARATRGVVGKLEHSETPQDINDVIQALSAFVEQFPQVIHDDSEDAVENGKKIRQWLLAKGASFTAANFTACLNDIFTSLVFDAARIGLSRYGHRITGENAVRSMPSKDFEALLKPYEGDRPKRVEEQTAAEYKANNPRAWEDLRQPVRAMEERCIMDAVDKFMQLAPAYVPSDTNRKLILDEVAAQGLRVNQASLLAVFNELVAAKKMKVNEKVSAKVGSTTRIDFNG